MSLKKQLWISVAVLMTFTFGASFVLVTFSAQKYLKQQLYLKNIDNATSLALSMSQVAEDPVTVELLLSAQFDSGHYQFIRLVDPHGKVLIEHSNQEAAIGIPGWFQKLVPLQPSAGVAQVQNGWKQYGTLFLQSHSRFAYESLWQEMLNLLFWFLGVATLAGILGTLAIRSITRPLGKVVEQAEAIGARRFITVAEPSIPELSTLVSAMNGLSIRVKRMLKDDSERLENLRREIEHDSLTGLLLRAPFLKRIESVLSREDASAAAVVVIARLAKLADINRSLGREATDQLLRRIGKRMSALCSEKSEWAVGRLNGADFALLAPGNNAAFDLAQEVADVIHLAIDDPGYPGERLLHVGGTATEPGESLSGLLSRTDAALIAAERNGSGAVQIVGREVKPIQVSDLDGWRVALNQALDTDSLKLARFPVVDCDGKLLQFEAPVRVCIGGDWLAAGRVLPWAARLDLLPRLDLRVVDLALVEISKQGKPLGINISSEALCDPGFRTALNQKLYQTQELAKLLWLEVSESAAIHHAAEFRQLVEALKPLGTKIGVEHVGPQFFRIGDLHDLGIDYVKIDSSLIRGIHEHPGSQAFLRGLCMIVHSIGLTAIAEGVQCREEVTSLVGLGVNGMTGPGITLS
jgi:predicted signal transduction protein with EAL and GGDEF domain